MPRNGSGTYALPVGNPVVTGTTISSTWANNTLTDIANTLTGSLAADGQTTASGNLNMGTNRIINAGDPLNAQDVATKYYVDQLIGALGTMAYQNADAVDITGGDVVNINLDLHEMTNEIYLPVGPTSLRTTSPIVGLLRYNTDGPFYEGFVDGIWHKFQTYPEGNYTAQYLVVAGGGGGGPGVSANNVPCGGGGAGGVLTGFTTFESGSTYTAVVGGGGAAHTQGSASSLQAPLSIYIANCVGGGYGGYNYDDYRDSGGNGGSGGGQGRGASGGATPGTGTVSQGNNGGAYSGGGASSVGASSGGAGYYSSITGTGVYYGGGGGGTAQSGGAGGGGAGGNSFGAPGPTGVSGTINTGGGGGGAGGYSNGAGSGGSGVVIISVPTVNYSGVYTGSPTITTSGANTVITFTSSGTYTA